MATLPDLRTRYIVQASWWNAIDNGADSLDPVDLLDYDGVDSWEEYDNGLEGSLRRHPALRWRAKTDGWIIVYFDETYGAVNPEDFLTELDARQAPDLTRTVLSEELDALRQHGAPNTSFTHADVPIYNYRYPDMNHYRVMHSTADQGYGGNVDGEYAFNPASPGPYHYVIDAWGLYGGYVRFDGDDIVTSSSAGASRAREDVAEQGYFTTPGTYYGTRTWVPSAGGAAHSTLVVE